MTKYLRNDSQCENLVEENGASDISQPEPLTIDINNSRNIHVGVETILNEDVMLRRKVFLKNDNIIEPIDIKHLCPNCQLLLKNIRNEVIQKPKENVSHKWIQLALLVVFLIILISINLVAIFLLFKRSTDHQHNILYYPQSNIMEDEFLEYPENAGLCFVQRTDWRAKPLECLVTKQVLPVGRVIISHSASMPCNNSENCKQSVKNIQLLHMDGKKFFDIGYNFLVGGDGCIYIGRGWDYVGAHTLHYNVNSTCISLIGTFTTMQPTEQQINATIQLIKLGVKLGKLSKKYALHAMCQFKDTESPGKYLYDIISKWDSFHISNTTPPCKYHAID